MFTRRFVYFLFFQAYASILSASSLLWDRLEANIEMEAGQEEAQATFRVTNKSDKPVRISHIESSCGCTGHWMDRRLIRPNESIRIIGIFRKGKREGTNRYSLRVFLDNQSHPAATLIMNVKIPVLIEAIPQFVHWSKDNRQTKHEIRLLLDKRYIHEITDIEYDQARLKVIKKSADPGINADFILTVQPTDYNTFFTGSIRIKGTGPDEREHETQVYAFIQP